MPWNPFVFEIGILRLREVAEMAARPVQNPSEAFRRTYAYNQSTRVEIEGQNPNARESKVPVRTQVEKLWKDLGKITAE